MLRPATRYLSSANKMAPRHFHLVLDWDGTMTHQDTTALIGAASLSRAAAFRGAQSPASRPMSYYGEAYMVDYSAWKAASKTSEDSRRTVADEVEYLSSSRHVELASFNRVRDAVLESEGMRAFVRDAETRDAWMREEGAKAVRAGDVRIRDAEGLKSLLARVQEVGDPWDVVSVSWSRMFIVGALQEAGLVHEGDEQLRDRIWCNELTGPVGKLASSDRDGVICTAEDKRRTFETVIRRRIRDGTGGTDKEPTTVYSGDSTTDLGCLDLADIGICMRDEQRHYKPEEDKLGKTWQRLGFQCRPVGQRVASKATDCNVLYWTSSFSDIEKHLYG